MFCTFKQYCTVEIWIFKKKKFLLVHIKLSFSIEFSPRIDVNMCIKVKSYVTFKNIYKKI